MRKRKPRARIELATFRLQGGCSTIELPGQPKFLVVFFAERLLDLSFDAL